MEQMSTLREDSVVREALDTLRPPSEPDVDRAFRRQMLLRRRPVETPAGTLGRIMGRLSFVRKPLPAIPIAAALVLALSLLTSPVQSLAAQFLTIFRVQDVQPITIPDNLQGLPNLSKLGDMTPAHPTPRSLQPTQVSSVSAASAAVGFTLETPSQLPNGLPAQPSLIGVTHGQTLGFTFRSAKAGTYLASIGHGDVALPAKFDGASLQFTIQPVAGLAYLPAGTSLKQIEAAAKSGQAGSSVHARSLAALFNGAGVIVFETKSPSLSASGVSASELRDFLLSLPGIPASTKAQLRAIGDWRNTLPIPAMPGSRLHKVQVDGAPGVVGQNGGTRMILWVKNGVVYGATGAKVSESELLTLAGSMK